MQVGCTGLYDYTSVLHTDKQLLYGPDNVPSTQSGPEEPQEEEENLYAKSKKEQPLERACKFRESDLLKKTKRIEEEFADLSTIAVRDMELQKITPEDIALYLTNRRGLEPVYAGEHIPLLEQRVEDVRKKATLKAVFIEVLCKYYSWFNHDLLKGLINTFCKKRRNVKKCLAQFEQSFHKYSTERVSEYVQYGSVRQTDVRELVLKVDKKWEVVDVKQVVQIQNTVADILKIEKCTLYLRTVENGCFQMTFLIPEFVAATVFPLKFPREQKAALLEAGVIELHCDGYDLQLSAPSKESQDSDPEVYPTSES